MRPIALALGFCLSVLGLIAFRHGGTEATPPPPERLLLKTVSMRNEGVRPAAVASGAEYNSTEPLFMAEKLEGMRGAESPERGGSGSNMLQFNVQGATGDLEVIDVIPELFDAAKQIKSGVDALVMISEFPEGFVVADVDPSQMIRASSRSSGATSLVRIPAGDHGTVLEIPDYYHSAESVSGGRRTGSLSLVPVGEGRMFWEIPPGDWP